jgi:hypothetical protein
MIHMYLYMNIIAVGICAVNEFLYFGGEAGTATEQHDQI